MKHLLYVEDNHITQQVVMRRLESVAKVFAVSTLEEARLLLASQAFALVLADCNLPDGNALVLIRELRTRFSPSQLPIILVSASMDQLLRVQALNAGANECLAMPTPWAEFLATIERMLECPYVRDNPFKAVAVTWVEGLANERPWVYCPELNLRLDGENIDLLHATMAQRVRTAAAAAALPFVMGVKVSERLVERAPAQAPAHGCPEPGPIVS